MHNKYLQILFFITVLAMVVGMTLHNVFATVWLSNPGADTTMYIRVWKSIGCDSPQTVYFTCLYAAQRNIEKIKNLAWRHNGLSGLSKKM